MAGTGPRRRWPAGMVLAVATAIMVSTALPALAQQPAPRPPVRPAPARPPPPAPAAEPQPAPVPAAAGELQPVVHARNAGIVTCLDGIARAAAGAIEAPHAAMSQWRNEAADRGPFTSVIGLAPDNRAAPNAAAFIYLTPTPTGGCHGATIQVFPTARTCGAVQADLSKEGRTIANLAAIPVMLRPDGSRTLLLQAPGGCVIVAIGVVATEPAIQAPTAQAPRAVPAPGAAAAR